jgi:glycosyltransferase involved in cell wall biosynthesis
VSEPSVTVVIPTYNRADFISRSIRSALNQTVHDIEVVVVDDASTDETRTIIEAVEDPRVRVVPTASRSGPSAARNRGIEAARGRLVAFLDSDDEWLPSKLERQCEVLNRAAPAGAVVTGVWLRRGSDCRPDVTNLDREAFEQLLSYRGSITTSGLVFDRDVLGNELYFDERFPAIEERELLIRISRRHAIESVPEPLYIWHHHSQPRASNVHRQIVGRRLIIEKYANDLASRPRLAAFHYFRLAMVQHRAGDHEGACTSIVIASRLDASNKRLRLLREAGRLDSRALGAALSTYVMAGRIRVTMRSPSEGDEPATTGR